MKKIILLSIISFLIVFPPSGFSAPPLDRNLPPRGDAPPAGGEFKKVQLFQALLKQAQAAGIPTQEAEKLNNLSRHAAKAKNREEADRLLEQAVALLQKDLKEKGITPTTTATTSEPKARSPATAPSTGAAPVFLVAFSHHYAGPGGYYATAEEVRKTGAFFDKYRIPGTLFFDGILVERLLKEDPSLIQQIRQWNLPLGYHGEETHGPYPVGSELMGEVHPLKEAQGYRGTWSLTTGKDWPTAVQQVIDRYSHHQDYRIDESTRRLDRRKEVPTAMAALGGLALVQKTFGKDVSMIPSHALESAPVGYAFRKMSGFMLDQPAVPVALHALHIFRMDSYADELMQIAGPEHSLFWFMGRIMTKGDEEGEAHWRLQSLRRTLDQLDRSQPRLLLVGFSKFSEEEAATTVRFLENDFFPQNPGSGWVSGESLLSPLEPEKDHALTAAELDQGAQYLLDHWKNRPPDVVKIGTRIASLCDLFEGLAIALASFRETGRPPAEVRLNPLYGPRLESDLPSLKTPLPVSLSDLTLTASQALRSLQTSEPDRFIPATLPIRDRSFNCAELLYGMAQAYGCIRKGSVADITLIPSSVFPPYADTLQKVFTPKARQPLCYTQGQLWTVKPVRVRATANPVPLSATPPSAPPLESPTKILAVFSANLDSDSPCYREKHAGADLYSVTFDLVTHKATNLKRLTRQAGQAEWFPALSPDGHYVVYNQSIDRERGAGLNSLRVLDLTSGRDEVLLDQARFAAFDASGQWLYYSVQKPREHQLCRSAITLTPKGLTLSGKPERIADSSAGSELVEDPAPFPDGSAVVFHRKEQDQGAGLALIQVDGNHLKALTPFDGAGHASVSPDGQAVACTRSRDGKIIVIRRRGTEWQAPEILPISTDASDYVTFDPRFGEVREARHSYVEWITPIWMMVTTHGSPGGKDFRFSRIFLVHLPAGPSAPQLIDFSGPVEQLAGQARKDFCTADALPAR